MEACNAPKRAVRLEDKGNDVAKDISVERVNN
jgi:hypothetical protein